MVMLQNICQFCTNACQCDFVVECPDFNPRCPNNVCPDCGFIHAKTFPTKCKNCGKDLPHNEEALAWAKAKGYIKRI